MKRYNARVGLIRSAAIACFLVLGWPSFVWADEPAAPSSSSEATEGAAGKETSGSEAVPPVVEGEPGPPPEAGDVQERAVRDQRLRPITGTLEPGIALFSDVPSAQGGKSFALPADKQAMLGTLSREKTTKSIRMITVNVQQLNLNMIVLPLRQDLTVRAAKKKVESRATDNYTWFGSLMEQPGDAILVVHGQDVTGTIRSGGELYRITPLGGGMHALVQVDESQFPPDDPPAFMGAPSLQKGGLLPQQDALRNALVAAFSPVTVDVLVAYTPSARDAVGGVKQIQDLIQLAESESNVINENSQVNMRYRVVDTVEVNYSENSRTYGQILDQITGKQDGFMDEIHSHRDRVGADLVVLLVNQSQYCGMAWLGANQKYAFSIVYYNCATGNYSFAHEIGHNMGANHDPENASGSPYPYGHGNRVPGQWRTIMAYACPITTPPSSCPRRQHWSNPNVSVGGVATGDATTRNNARVLNETAKAVAGFRASPRPVALQNHWKPHQYVNIQFGPLAAGAIQPTWLSAMWTLEPVTPGVVRIRNVRKPDQYVNIQFGPLAAGAIQPGWLSAMWTLEPVTPGVVRIRNVWKPDQYVNIQFGALAAGAIRPGWLSAMWTLRFKPMVFPGLTP